MNNQQDSHTVTDTSNINKQKQTNRNEPQTSEHGNTIQSNNPKQTLTHEQKSIKKFMYREKTTLRSLRNIEWKTVKTDTHKINQILLYISVNNITELNELIYVETIFVCEKIGILSKSTKAKSKLEWEIRLETQIKHLQNRPI